MYSRYMSWEFCSLFKDVMNLICGATNPENKAYCGYRIFLTIACILRIVIGIKMNILLSAASSKSKKYPTANFWI